MRVLLLASDPEVRSWLGGLIAARGHLVASHATTEGALAAFSAADYPLIVLGLGGADGDRLALVRRLRSLPEGEQLVILAVVDAPGRDDLFAILEAGVDDVLHEPRDLE